MIPALLLWSCQSLSTTSGSIYIARSDDKAIAQQEADTACYLHESPESFNSCVSLGCKKSHSS